MAIAGRRAAILKRWFDITGLAVAGAAAVAAAGPFVLPWVWSRLGPERALVPLLALGAVLVVLRGWRAAPGWLGLRRFHFFVFPPAWVAALLGYELLRLYWLFCPPAALDRLSPEGAGPLFAALAGLPGWAVPAAGVVVMATSAVLALARGLLHSSRSGTPADAPPPPRTGAEPLESFDAIREWLSTDAPIGDPGRDQFGHDEVARRIAYRLASEGSADGPPSMALVGPFGSGKTSILKLTENHLRRKGVLGRRLLLVPVSAWPLETPEAAVRQILTAVIGALSREADTTCLASVPPRYVQAVTSAGGWWAAAAHAIREPGGPESVVERLDAVALALGLRIVVWVEDLERFAGAASGTHTGDPGAIAGEGVRLAPIRALLHLLDTRERITVVLASTSLDTRFDMDKLARFIEHVPGLDTQRGADCVEHFRSGVLAWLRDRGMVDPVGEARPQRLIGWARVMGPEIADLLDGLGDSPQVDEQVEKLEGQGYEIPVTTKHLSLICSTPRRLKQALRLALHVCGRLAGEIDPDDVLVMSVIRTADPDLYALVDRHIQTLRDGWPHGGKGEPPSPFQQALEVYLDARPPRYRTAIRAALRFVFGDWEKTEDSQRWPKPQGLKMRHHADYWRRFSAVPELREEERDQPVLRAMARWEESGEGELPSFLTDPDRAKAVEDFGAMLSADRTLDLLAAAIARLGQQDSETWPLDEYREPPGIVELWRMLRRKQLDARRLETILEHAVREESPRNLPVVRHLMYWFFTRPADLTPSLDENAVKRLRSALAERLANLTADEVVAALRGADPWCALHLAWGVDRLRKEKPLRPPPFEGWERFAATLLDAAEKAPEVVIPQIVPFVVKVPSPGSPIFHREMARALFDLNRLREIVRAHPLDPEMLHPQLRDRYRVFVRELGAGAGPRP